MQATKRPTGLGTAAHDYKTLVHQAINKVTGFGQLYKELERAINGSGKSKSILTNYSLHLAHLSLYYQQLPTKLDNEQVPDYLNLVKLSQMDHLLLPSSRSLFMVCAMPVSCVNVSPTAAACS
jgi:hypothetical protein